MNRRAKIQIIAVVLAAATLGYVAGTGQLASSPRADAAPETQPAARVESPPTQVVNAGQKADQPVKDRKKPNILVIFGDDIGQSNVSAYTHGLMGYHTPNIDRIAKEG